MIIRIVFLLILSVAVRAQTICIPIRVADTIEFQLQQKYHLDTLAAIRLEHIDSLNSVIVSRDSLNSNLKEQLKLSRLDTRDSVALVKVYLKQEKRKKRNAQIVAGAIIAFEVVKIALKVIFKIPIPF